MNQHSVSGKGQNMCTFPRKQREGWKSGLASAVCRGCPVLDRSGAGDGRFRSRSLIILAGDLSCLLARKCKPSRDPSWPLSLLRLPPGSQPLPHHCPPDFHQGQHSFISSFPLQGHRFRRQRVPSHLGIWCYVGLRTTSPSPLQRQHVGVSLPQRPHPLPPHHSPATSKR